MSDQPDPRLNNWPVTALDSVIDTLAEDNLNGFARVNIDIKRDGDLLIKAYLEGGERMVARQLKGWLYTEYRPAP